MSETRTRGLPPAPIADEAPVPRRPDRKPFGNMEQRLLYPPREGYHRHWFNDDPGRTQRALEAGYEFVRDEQGKNVSRVAGRGEGGRGLNAYLMEIPQQWYEDDMRAAQERRDQMMAEIKAGQHGQKAGDNRYVPQNLGIKITEGTRR